MYIHIYVCIYVYIGNVQGSGGPPDAFGTENVQHLWTANNLDEVCTFGVYIGYFRIRLFMYIGYYMFVCIQDIIEDIYVYRI